MIDNSILMDEKIKNRIDKEINDVPDNLQQLIVETVNKLPDKRKPKMKLRYGIAAVLIALISLTTIGITNPTYAKSIPVVGQLFKAMDSFLFSKYDNFSSNVNMTKESNGYKITVSKVAYDGIYLTLAYKIESKKPISFKPNDIGLVVKLSMNDYGSFSMNTIAQHVEFSNDKKSFTGTSDIVLDELLNHSKIPDKFNLEIEIEKIFEINNLKQGINNEISGNWNFNTQVISEKAKGNVKEINCNINLDKIEKGLTINKLTLTPLNSILYYPHTNNSSKISYIMYDDKGRIFPIKSQGISQGVLGDSCFMNFKEVCSDSKKLTFIPYNNTEHDKNLPEIISTDLNIKGKTTIPLGKYGNLLITKIKTENRVTKLYYRSLYGALIIPYIIKDKHTGEIIYMTNNEYTGNSSEYVVTYNKAIGNGDYTIICPGNSKIYTNMKFSINIK